jgi:hypothetical protein
MYSCHIIIFRKTFSFIIYPSHENLIFHTLLCSYFKRKMVCIYEKIPVQISEFKEELSVCIVVLVSLYSFFSFISLLCYIVVLFPQPNLIMLTNCIRCSINYVLYIYQLANNGGIWVSCFSRSSNHSGDHNGNRENRGQRGKMSNAFEQQRNRQREATSNKKYYF